MGRTFKVLHNLSKVQRQGVFNNSNDRDDSQNYNNFIITIFKAKPAIKNDSVSNIAPAGKYI